MPPVYYNVKLNNMEGCAATNNNSTENSFKYVKKSFITYIRMLYILYYQQFYVVLRWMYSCRLKHVINK